MVPVDYRPGFDRLKKKRALNKLDLVKIITVSGIFMVNCFAYHQAYDLTLSRCDDEEKTSQNYKNK